MKPCSGRFVVRLPEVLHAELRDEAVRTGKSLNQVCIERLQGRVAGRHDAGARVAPAGSPAPEVVREIVRQWSGKLAGLVLFGSAARGDETGESDIDVLLVMKPEVKITRALYLPWDEFCERQTQDLGRVSPHFVALPGDVRDAGGLWYEAAIEGIVLWEEEGRVSGFIRSVRRAMAEGRIRRRTLHGSPYWIKEAR